MWLGVLNPLVLLHLIGDAHNEALMLGLMCVGLVLALEYRPALGAVVITLGALVKAPAGLAIAFLIPIWASQLEGRRQWLRAAQRAIGVAAFTAVIVTALAGTGFGWIRTLDTPTRARTWMSLTTDLGWITGTLLHHMDGPSVDETRQVFWLAGLVVAAGVTLVLWRRSQRIGPVAALGLCLAAFVVAGPVVHPWYLLWAVVPLAAASQSPMIRRTVAIGSAALLLLVMPGGIKPGVPAVIGAALGLTTVLVIAVALTGSDRERLWAPLVAAPRDLGHPGVGSRDQRPPAPRDHGHPPAGPREHGHPAAAAPAQHAPRLPSRPPSKRLANTPPQPGARRVT
jgi:hypothetical protein